jgi:hypothetical protein
VGADTMCVAAKIARTARGKKRRVIGSPRLKSTSGANKAAIAS